MRRIRVFVALAALVLLSITVACRAGNNDTENRSSRGGGLSSPGDIIAYEGPRTLRESEWSLRYLNGHEIEGEGYPFLLVLSNGEITGEGGCIGFSIYHKLDGDRMLYDKPGFQEGGYKCGKPAGVKQQAVEVMEIARSVERVMVSDSRVELSDGSGGVAAFVPPPQPEVDPALAGTEWTLIVLNDREPLPGKPSTLEIGKSEMMGYGACNVFGGAVSRISGGEIEWSQSPNEGFASTLVGCGRAAGRQEMAFEKALMGAGSYVLDGDRLQLRDVEGDTTLVFRRGVQ